jgi:hypothetical protein
MENDGIGTGRSVRQRWTENLITGFSQRASIEPEGLPPDVLPVDCSRNVRLVPPPGPGLCREYLPISPKQAEFDPIGKARLQSRLLELIPKRTNEASGIQPCGIDACRCERGDDGDPRRSVSARALSEIRVTGRVFRILGRFAANSPRRRAGDQSISR